MLSYEPQHGHYVGIFCVNVTKGLEAGILCYMHF